VQVATKETVVREGLALLRSEGFDALSMRALAARLGIKAASLYNHVRDKDELLTLMADAICAEVPPLDGSKPWRVQLEGMARRLRRVLTSHRDGARVLAATPPIGAHRLRLIEQVLSALRTAGLSPTHTVDVAASLNSWVVGFVLDETQGTGGDGELARRALKSLPRSEFPNLVALADVMIDAPADRRFALGLRALLDGFELRFGAARALR